MQLRISFLCFFFTFMILSSASAQDIEILAGDYQLKKSGESWFEDGSGPGEILYSGDSVRSLQDSYLKIRLPDGSSIFLGPGAEVLFMDIQSSGASWYIPFNLSQGMVLVEKAENDTLISMKTPHIISNLDSEVIIDANNDSTTVYVIEGRAMVMDHSTMILFVIESGRMAVITNESATSPYLYDEEQVQELRSQFVISSGGISDIIPSQVVDLMPYIIIIMAAIVILVAYIILRKGNRSPY